MTKLTLGPILFNWEYERKRDFYYQIADEAPVDTVYIGEIVCSKRMPFFEPYLEKIIERLQKSGKNVVYSTLALFLTNKELEQLRISILEKSSLLIEANDIAGISLLQGKPHHIGPYVNVYNELTLSYLANHGATQVTLPPELPKASLEAIAAAKLSCELEVQVFGRFPLAISARCAHARAYGLHKHNCRYICHEDPDGMEVQTLDHQPFLSVNGLQTLSYPYGNLLSEIASMKKIGIANFRLSPQGAHMTEVAKLFRAVIDEHREPGSATESLCHLYPEIIFSGFDIPPAP